MTKQEIKTLCESDPRLQWWAMVLFGELVEAAGQHAPYRKDDQAIASFVRTKVDEFPQLIIQRQLEMAKNGPSVDRLSVLEARVSAIEDRLPKNPGPPV